MVVRHLVCCEAIGLCTSLCVHPSVMDCSFDSPSSVAAAYLVYKLTALECQSNL